MNVSSKHILFFIIDVYVFLNFFYGTVSSTFTITTITMYIYIYIYIYIIYLLLIITLKSCA
jgi:hypothetical protein